MRYLNIGNGRILINIDEFGRLTDLYFPYVGMENQSAGKPIRYYFFDGKNIYEDTKWKVTVNYMQDVNIAEIRADINETVSLVFYDFTDLHDPLYYRIIKILNKGNEEIKGKLIFLIDLDLYSSSFGDTAFFDPQTSSIIHYKSKRYVGAKLFGIMKELSEYTIGKDEVYYDVQDGRLSMKPIDNGNVQFAMAVDLDLLPKGTDKAYFVLAFERKLSDLRKLLSRISPTSVETTFTSNYMFWQNWIRRAKQINDKNVEKLYKISLLVIKNHMDVNGSIIASSDYSFVGLYGDSYNYCWPRDSAISAHALDIAGYGDIAMKHYQYISEVVTEEGFLYHKYNPDKTLASSWHPWIFRGKQIYPIQEDETALQVWAIANHYQIYKDIDELIDIFKNFLKPAIRFLMRYVEDGLPKPSFDLWEERYGIHIYTVSTVYGALVSASELARDIGDEVLASDMLDVAEYMKEEVLRRMVHNGRFIRRIDENGNKDLVIDASMYSPYFFGMVDVRDPIMINTIRAIENSIKVSGGIARYENDMYKRVKSQPNPWIITTLWLAEYYLDLGQREKALDYINWAMSRALPSGLLPEQVDPENFTSTSVVPLVWSHAEFIITVDKLISR
ncbi:glycoside hydrolase family 15 protein [Sulfurisphaera tokodaii]|uniref:Glucan 1,4-alpha-glucosidase n=2 Tax=Sulfurisphaera tokodaii TaxID=111955 RepID=F9VN95_SULTO|nr:glycoside hydrolase family 15 protein [Sulfurisphaera tokodaii]BAK54392.1 glucan 1,4-alpha-glucosidase [Sulfurisphaera tokodaii str. 7]HII74387.1 glycoside hydrolase family 15 protein [Sulfurisphaera tokodaii]